MGATYICLDADRVYACGCVWHNYGRASEPTRLEYCERHLPHTDPGAIAPLRREV